MITAFSWKKVANCNLCTCDQTSLFFRIRSCGNL